jgi:ATP-binding cassette, subfamily C, bacterial
MKTLKTICRLLVDMISISSRKAIASVALMVALTLTEGLSLLTLLPLLGLVGIDEPTTVPNIVSWFNSVFALIGVHPTIGTGLAFYVAIAGVRALLNRVQGWVNVALREEFTSQMRVRIYKAIAGAEWRFLVTRRSSEFVHLLTGEIGVVGSAAFQIITFSVTVTTTMAYLAMAFHLSPIVALVVLVCAASLAWIARGRFTEARALGSKASTMRGRLHSAISEHVGSMKTAKSYGAAARHTEHFTKLADDLRHVSLEVNSMETRLQQGLEFGSIAMLAVIVYCSLEVLYLKPAQLLVLLFVFARLMPRLVAIYRQIQGLASALPVVEIVSQLEADCLESAETRAERNLEITLSKEITFKDVAFSYLRRQDTTAISHVNLRITAGLTTAIVGSSGAGKSTLADLLIGLLHPTKGQILVDDQVLDAEHLTAWREHISYVPQETFLFHDSIRQNLAWAAPHSTDSDLWHALQLAAAERFVSSLPSGLDTVIGERGVMLSGGERQRLSLARALLRKPRVLVLDEATSSLDSETERRIQQAIEGLHHEMTIVIVTHRLSMISGADLIHVMEGGQLIESGTWDQLLAIENGRFKALCQAQGIYHRPAPALDEKAVLTQMKDESYPFNELATELAN